MKKKLSRFVILASIALLHINAFAVPTFIQPSETNSLVQHLFHQALNSINKFLGHSNTQTTSLDKTELQATITKYYISSNANIANKTNNQHSADLLRLKTFFDKNETTTQEFVSSDGKPSTQSERAFV